MRRLVFGLGGLQVLVTTALLAGVAAYAGGNLSEAIILGASLSLSSTAIVLELLSNQGRLKTNVGRSSFAVLLLQDLAVIPILMFISLLAAGSGGSVLGSLGRALLQAAIALAVIVVFGRVLLQPLFRLVAATRSRDLFIATALFVIIAAGVIANQAGLSMALGAFVAGLAARRNRIPQGDRSHHRAVQGAAARHFLLHRRHGYRRARIAARAAAARRRASSA